MNDGPTVLYRGSPHTVEVRQARVLRTRLYHVNGSIWILMAMVERRAAPDILGSWLREQAKCLIPMRVEELARRFGFRYRRIFIRAQRTRWGSCSSRGNLSFNFRLVMAPPEVLDYVILHELTHLKIPNHSRRFWAALSEICPEYERSRRWLRRNERALMAIRG